MSSPSAIPIQVAEAYRPPMQRLTWLATKDETVHAMMTMWQMGELSSFEEALIRLVVALGEEKARLKEELIRVTQRKDAAV